ncbi:MAG: hypothetical protein O3A87_05310 [Verrucomicrobia bacterium]|nr:hypothetical protein [Verrucomicrobiota bacterium]MDA1005884.1 hypothetical protein [Verrucomicrobiota bacterium]
MNEPETVKEREDILLTRGIVRSWEKLRLIYNGVMVGPSILFATLFYHDNVWWTDGHSSAATALLIQIGVGIVLFALGANICFCLGPYVELVIVALGYPVTGRKLRPVLFGMGLLGSLSPVVVGILLYLA